MTTAIVINLDIMKALMLEFVRSRGGSEDDTLMKALTLGEFLLWLRMKQQEQSNGKEDSKPAGANPAVVRQFERR